MTDIWSFLLQTLTASGAAALLLAVKAVFRDKLSPRWQFAIWGVLGLVLLVPAGRGGRYVLVNWPLFVETLRSLCTGEYGVLARVATPVPLGPRAVPRTGGEWLFALYAAGVLALLAWYLVSYLRLRRMLRRGTPVEEGRLREAAERYGLPVCPAVEAEGLSSAFVCGVFRPVLALPAGEEADDKVLLHELLHLKYHDAAWGLVICLFRCLHWCNPLLWHCANLAGNDLESLCDQRVLERLEGEERRDYGRILLSMASERYARTPGTSSMANGGKNIRRRIQAIARFKRYPQGMALASVCVALVLAPPLLAGTRARAVRQEGGVTGVHASAAMASARTTFCTTFAGAFDAYAKAVLDGNVLYRAMCAPLEDQNGLADQLRQAQRRSAWPPDSGWASGLTARPDIQSGYQIYNLTPAGEGMEGLLSVSVIWTPELGEWDGTVQSGYMAVQPLRAERQGERWVVLPLGEFQILQKDAWTDGDRNLPAMVYEAQAGDFTLRQSLQTTCTIESYEEEGGMSLFSSRQYQTIPQPDGEFDRCYYHSSLTAVYTGPEDQRRTLRSVGASTAPMDPGEARPDLRNPGSGNGTGSSSDGKGWGVQSTFRWDMHGNEIFLGGGGGGYGGNDAGFYDFPACYAADLYVNGERTAELTLLPKEGGFS